jgi:hypothetical protein
MTNMAGKPCFSGLLRFAEGKVLTPQQFEYLLLFCNGSPRHKQNIELLKDFPDPIREAVGLPLGEKGEFFVSSRDFAALSEAGKVRFCSR